MGRAEFIIGHKYTNHNTMYTVFYNSNLALSLISDKFNNTRILKNLVDI